MSESINLTVNEAKWSNSGVDSPAIVECGNGVVRVVVSTSQPSETETGSIVGTDVYKVNLEDQGKIYFKALTKNAEVTITSVPVGTRLDGGLSPDGTGPLYSTIFNKKSSNPNLSNVIIDVKRANISGLLPEFKDVDGSTLKYGIVRNPVSGSVSIDSSGMYSYTPFQAFAGVDEFIFKVTDRNESSITYKATVYIAAEDNQTINHPPVSGNFSLSTPYNTPYVGKIVASDPDGNNISFEIVDRSINGNVVLNTTTGDFVYTPNQTYSGSDRFRYRVVDELGATSFSYTASIAVEPRINTAPVSSSVSFETEYQTVKSGQLPVATDGELDVVTYSLATQASHGSASVTQSGAYVYTPSTGYSGSDKFVFRVSDSFGGSNTYDVNVTVKAQIIPVNRAPVSSSGSFSAIQGVTVSGQLPAATDADGDTITYALEAAASHGTATVSSTGAYTYTSANNYEGIDSFVFSVSDGKGGKNTYNIDINVNLPVNNAPISSDTTISSTSGVLFTGQLPIYSDIDGDIAEYSLETPALFGIATVSPNGSYTYTSNSEYTGNDNFDFRISDSRGGSNTYTVSIVVNSVPNDSPISSNVSISTIRDTVKSGQLPTATDANGDSVTYSASVQPAHGTVTVSSTGAYTYTPSNGYTGPDSFKFTVSDGKGGTNTYTVTITVDAPPNSAPIGSNFDISTTQDIAKSGQLPTATDADGDTITYALGTAATKGNATVSNAGAYTYVPNKGYVGADSFSYIISDGKGGSNTYAVNVTVNAIPNRAPVSANGTATTLQGSPVSGQLPAATDADNDTVTYATVSDPVHGTVTISNSGAYTYTPTAGYSGSDSFTFSVSDGKGGTNTYTMNVTITANTAPVSSNGTATTTQDTSYSGQLPTATDANNDAITYTRATQPSHGTVSVGTSGSYTYIPTAGYVGSDSFTFTVSDTRGGSNTYTMTIDVQSVGLPKLAFGTPIYFAGDSITDEKYSTAGYAGRATSKVFGRYAPGVVSNRGSAGATAADGVKDIPFMDILTDVSGPGVVVVMFGQNTDQPTSNLLTSRMTTMLNAWFARGHRVIALIKPYNAAAADAQSELAMLQQRSEYTTGTLRIVRTDQIVANSGAGDQSKGQTLDGSHLNDEGGEIVSTAIAAILDEWSAEPARTIYTNDISSIIDGTFNGTAGAINAGISGQVPTGWAFTRLSGTATATSTIVTEDGMNAMEITIDNTAGTASSMFTIKRATTTLTDQTVDAHIEGWHMFRQISGPIVQLETQIDDGYGGGVGGSPGFPSTRMNSPRCIRLVPRPRNRTTATSSWNQVITIAKGETATFRIWGIRMMLRQNVPNYKPVMNVNGGATSMPRLSGTMKATNVATCTPAPWFSKPANPTFTYQWYIDTYTGTDPFDTSGLTIITGETASTYTIKAGDVGKKLRCMVTATNSVGSSSYMSPRSAVIAA